EMLRSGASCGARSLNGMASLLFPRARSACMPPRVGRNIHMKKAVIACVLLMLASSAFTTVSKDEVKRLNDAGAILSELRNSPDKAIPEELWAKAQCVIVIPSMKKAAFVVGGEYGSGVMSCRTNAWSA